MSIDHVFDESIIKFEIEIFEKCSSIEYHVAKRESNFSNSSF